MPAIIPSLISPQNFELARAQICAILALELANQATLDAPYPAITKVWEERCIAFDADTEFPAINVSLHKGDYSNSDVRKADGKYLFNIDVYIDAPTSDNGGPGDQRAMYWLTKIVGVVRTILMWPKYRQTLLLPPGTLVGFNNVDRFFLGDRTTVADALSSVVGRVQYAVGAIETVGLSEAAALTLSTTKVYLHETDQGFYYEYIPPVE